jgi:hypothetical protein
MSSRVAALVMAGVAGVLYFGVARPLRAQASAYADAFGAARVERRDATLRVADLQRRSQARARAVAAVKGAADDPAVTTRAVRRSVAQAVEGSRAGGVHLAIRPSVKGVDVNVSARGRAADVLDLTGQLARPEFGVVLERVSFTRSAGEVGLQVQGLGIAGTP